MKYFAYGSNMLTERLKARVSSATNPKPFALRGYRLRFHKRSVDCSGKCNIIKTSSAKDVVHGVIFDIHTDQIDDLDKAEGRGFGYDREELPLVLDDILHQVFAYVATAGSIDEALVPYRWYYDLVLSGAEQQSLPSDYLAGLKAIPFTEDPKSDRKTRLEALEALAKYAEAKKTAHALL